MSVHPVESLSAFLDDELPDAERRDVAAHLASCPSCARHLQELSAVDALARGTPPADAPAGYLEALPGRVRQRIRADRPASRRAPWVWPLAAGIALAVLAPLVLRQQPARERFASSPPTVAPAPPTTTVAPEQPPPPAAAPERRALARAPRQQAAPAPQARDAFVAAPPPAATPDERDRGVAAAAQEPLAAGGLEEGRMESAAERGDAPSSLKKADGLRQNATEAKSKAEQTFRDTSSLPASTAEEARLAREAWRRFVAGHTSGPHADEGRVRLIEAAVAVFRLTRDAGDRAIAEREGRAYLSSPDAPQAARVTATLRRLDDPR